MFMCTALLSCQSFELYFLMPVKLSRNSPVQYTKHIKLQESSLYGGNDPGIELY